MKIANLFLVLTLVIAGFSCGGGSGNTQAIANINIVGAASLFISSGSVTTSEIGVNEGTTTVNKLFKITSSGYVEEVSYKDKDGNTVTNENSPTGIYNVNASYVIVTFGFDQNNPMESYLVRKADGAVYKINSSDTGCSFVMAPTQMSNYFKNISPVTVDSNNKIYFYSRRFNTSCSGGGQMINTVYKITNPDASPSIEDYVPETDSATAFAIDSSGNALYNGTLAADYTSQVYRIKKTNGGLANFNPVNQAYWKASDGSVYYIAQDALPNKVQIKKLVVDSNFNVIETNYGSNFNSIDLGISPFQSYLLNFSNKTLIVTANINVFKAIEVYNVSSTPTVINLSSTFNSITTVTSSDSYYYIAGTNTSNNNVLRKCAISDHTCSDLLTAGQYAIYSMVVSNSGEVTFNALRMSDGAKVIATVNDSGVVTILNTTLNTQVTMLERVL